MVAFCTVLLLFHKNLSHSFKELHSILPHENTVTNLISPVGGHSDLFWSFVASINLLILKLTALYWRLCVLNPSTGIPHFIVFRFTELHKCCRFYKLKARLSNCKKTMTCFIVVAWNQTHNISEVYLYNSGKCLNVELLGQRVSAFYFWWIVPN